MRNHIPRICAGVVVLAFFLPWVKIELGILRVTVSGYDWATNAPQGSSLLFILIAAVGGAAFLHQRGAYFGLGILAGLSLLAGPMPRGPGTFAVGFFLTIIGILAMIVSAAICLEED